MPSNLFRLLQILSATMAPCPDWNCSLACPPTGHRLRWRQPYSWPRFDQAGAVCLRYSRSTPANLMHLSPAGQSLTPYAPAINPPSLSPTWARDGSTRQQLSVRKGPDCKASQGVPPDTTSWRGKAYPFISCPALATVNISSSSPSTWTNCMPASSRASRPVFSATNFLGSMTPT